MIDCIQRAITVFDIDDVFWPLNVHAAKIANVDYDKIVTFSARENPILDDDDRERLWNAYQTPRLHANMDFYPDAKMFGLLARDPRVDAWLCSNSIDMDVVEDKVRNMKEFLRRDYYQFRTAYNLITMENADNKRFPDNIFLLFDDSPKNAVQSKAKHIAMPRRPWNTSKYGRTVLEPVFDRVFYYDAIPEACEWAYDLLDREIGPIKVNLPAGKLVPKPL